VDSACVLMIGAFNELAVQLVSFILEFTSVLVVEEWVSVRVAQSLTTSVDRTVNLAFVAIWERKFASFAHLN
jgi:hypothetical protein